MDLEFTAEQELLRESVRRFLAEQAPISPYVRSMLDDARGTSDGVWLGLASLGVTDLLAPGAGTGMVDMAVVLEELGRAVHPGPFTSSAIGAVSVVALAGSGADRGAWLPGLGSGETVGCVALLEPTRRYEWRAPVARATPDGDGWRVDGTKVHVRDGVAADVWFVTASAGDGLGVFTVSRDDDDGGAVSIEPTPTVDGTRKEATITFDGARARRVGDGDATDAVAQVVDRLAVADVVDGVGAAARALELAVEYARTRVQFDRPIGSFQAVQHKLADMALDLERSWAAVYYAAMTLDADDAERHRAAHVAKAAAGDAVRRIGKDSVQIHGGIGYTWEHDLHLFVRRAFAAEAWLGNADWHHDRLAELLV